jgi:hypothetical protein
MKTVLTLLMLAMTTGCGYIPGCHVIQFNSSGNNDVYWVSPFVTNQNQYTHICAHLFASEHDRWAIEIPLKDQTLLLIALDRPTAVRVIGKFCHTGF